MRNLFEWIIDSGGFVLILVLIVSSKSGFKKRLM